MSFKYDSWLVEKNIAVNSNLELELDVVRKRGFMLPGVAYGYVEYGNIDLKKVNQVLMGICLLYHS